MGNKIVVITTLGPVITNRVATVLNALLVGVQDFFDCYAILKSDWFNKVWTICVFRHWTLIRDKQSIVKDWYVMPK